MPARQIDKFAPLHTLKSVVVNPKTDCQFEKNGFLTELKYICCKLGPFFFRKIPLGPITDKSASLSFTR